MGLRTPLLAKLQLGAVQQQEGSPTVRGLISTSVSQAGKVSTGNSRFPVLTSTAGRRSATGHDLSCGRGGNPPCQRSALALGLVASSGMDGGVS